MYSLVQKLSNTEGYLSQDSIYIKSVQQAKPMGKKNRKQKNYLIFKLCIVYYQICYS